MAFKAGAAYLELKVGDTSVLLHGVRQAAVTAAQAAESSLSNRMTAALSKVGDKAKQVGQAMTLGITLPVVGIAAAVGRSAFSMASDLQGAEISFTKLTGSVDKAKAVVQDLAQIAATTPFSTSAVIDGVRGFAQLGLSIDDAKRYLLAFGDAAAANGASSQGLELALLGVRQMMLKTKVSAEEMNQITENASIPAWSEMAKATGKPVAELMKLGEQGKLLTNDVLPAFITQLQKDYGGSMASQAGRLSAAWETFKETFTLKVANVLLKYAPQITQAMADIGNKAGPALDKAVPGLIGVGKAVGSLVGGIGSLLGRFASLNPQTQKWIVYLIAGAAAAGPMVRILGSITSVASGAVKGVSALIGVTQGLTAAIRGQALAEGASRAATIAHTVATKIATAAQWLWNLSLWASPITWIVVGIVALVAVFVLLWVKCSWFRNFWIGLWNIIKSAALAVARWFAGPFASFFVAIWNGLVAGAMWLWHGLKAVWDAVVSAAMWLWGALKAVWDAIVASVRWVVNAALAVFHFFLPGIKLVFGLIAAVVSTGWAVVTALFAVARTLIIDPIIAGFRLMWSNIVLAFELIKAVAVAVWGFLSPYIIGAARAIWSFLVTAWNAISGAVQAAWGFIAPYVIGAAQRIWSFLTAAWNAISAAATFVWSLISGAVSAAWSFIVSIVTASATRVWSFLTGVWNGISSGASALWNGIKTAASAAWNFVVGLVQAGVERIKASIDGFKVMLDKVKSFFNQLKDAANGGTGSLISFVAGIPGRVVDALGDLGGKLYNSGKSLIQGFVNGIKDKMGEAVDAARNGLNKVRDLFPFSPAKTGPFSGKGWVYYSGQSVSEGFAEGIQERADIAQDAALNLTAVTQSAVGTSGSARPAPVTYVTVRIGNEEFRGYVETVADERADARNEATARKLLGR
ncbi:tape measure protein [Dactylosporangium sp. CA-139066]|uniref:tape measure protein n=1 Tax=Dactylosporangium sp. CA-139066 TaxID=3239930 RepID=UPI003D8B7115